MNTTGGCTDPGAIFSNFEEAFESDSTTEESGEGRSLTPFSGGGDVDIDSTFVVDGGGGIFAPSSDFFF